MPANLRFTWIVATVAVVLCAIYFLAKSPGPAASTAIYAYGDSLTEHGYTTALEALLPGQVSIFNQGISGQSSGMIAVRQGGIELTFSAGTIPEAGPLEVIPIASVTPWNSGAVPSALVDGTLQGVDGRLARNVETGDWTFTRDEPGVPVPIANGTALISDESVMLTDDAILISWVGRNDVAFDWPNERAGVIASTKSMIDKQADETERFLVLSVPTATSETPGTPGYETIAEINNALASEWPDNYIDIRGQIIDRGLQMAGLEPSPADLAALAADTLPPSLMSDDVHPNAICNELVIAPLIQEAVLERGWL